MPLYLKICISAGGQIPISELMSMFGQRLHGAHMLEVVGEDATAFEQSAAVLCTYPLSQLRYPSMRCNFILSSEFTMSMVDIPASLLYVHSIRLRGVWLCWDRCRTFRSLRILCIDNVAAEFAPGWTAWEAMAEAAPEMERLSLRNTGCIIFPRAGHPITFPHLTHFDIVIGADKSLASLVSRFLTPKLSTLSITLKNTDQLRFISPLTTSMPTVRKLTLAVQKINTDQLHQFFVRLSSLDFLDVLRSDSAVLKALCRESDLPTIPSPMPCPSLSVLVISGANPVRVRAFIEARSSGSAAGQMKHLLFRQGFPVGDVYESDLEWLSSKYSVGASISYEIPDWIIRDYIKN
ncbi:hypothetical protein DFH09DRAFT_1098196 [Mycena vulgaris]|nr:hypothetical protein DFH09DRAFT_1098196 [Mycena vulgaris]